MPASIVLRYVAQFVAFTAEVTFLLASAAPVRGQSHEAVLPAPAARVNDAPPFPGQAPGWATPLPAAELAPVAAPAASSHVQLRLETVPGSNLFQLTLLGAKAHTLYEFFSSTNLGDARWRRERAVIGLGEDRPITLPWHPPAVTTQFLSASEALDDDGDGLSNRFEEWVSQTHPQKADSTGDGTGDGDGDPDGDGWSNAEEAQQGTDPLAWDPPPPPSGLQLISYVSGVRAALRWSNRSPDPVAFELERSGGSPERILRWRVDAGTFRWEDNALVPGYADPSYRVRTVFAQGESRWSDAAGPAAGFVGQMTRGPGGRMFLAARFDPGVTALRIHRMIFPSFFPKTWDHRYAQPTGNPIYLPAATDGWFEISTNDFQEGIVPIPESEAPPFATCLFCAEARRRDGVGGRTVCLGLWEATPYLPATGAFQEALQFLLRAAVPDFPFRYRVYASADSDEYAEFGPAGAIVQTGYWTRSASGEATINEFEPFEQITFCKNFAWDEALVLSGADPMGTGVGYDHDAEVITVTNGAVRYAMPTLEWIIAGGRPGLGLDAARISDAPLLVKRAHDAQDLRPLGIAFGPGTRDATLRPRAQNVHGLSCDAVDIVTPAPVGSPTTRLLPGIPVTGDLAPSVVYVENRRAALRTVGYYFARPERALVPADPEFRAGRSSELLVGSVGNVLRLAAWAQQQILNGDSNQFAYLGQAFAEAVRLDAHGAVVPGNAGLLSEYGEFLPLHPGRVRVTTEPDPGQGNVQGEVIVHVLKLQFDVDHDGVMDLEFTGPDQTTDDHPFLFWMNDDLDEPHVVDWNEEEEDDVQAIDLEPDRFRWHDHEFTLAASLEGAPGPRLPAIPCRRDLEDYARLWLVGLGALSRELTAEARIELSWRASDQTAPTLHLFRAVEPDGGIGYLTNEAIASLQIDPRVGVYVGAISPDAPLPLYTAGLPALELDEHYLFCGAAPGRGELVLQVRSSSGTLLGEASAAVEIRDIRKMMERWTVGERAGESPRAEPELARDGLPPETGGFEYPPEREGEVPVPYILHVHGWNRATWEKDAEGATMFKRLYWQGYRGRFGLFRWPTYSDFPATAGEGLSLTHFDESEWQAWQSAEGLARLLRRLAARYPNQLRLTAHSLGAIVAAEALRAGNQDAPWVTVFAIMQGAVPALSFDFGVPERKIPVIADDETPDLFSHHCTQADLEYFSACPGAAKAINFFNPVDWALAWWEIDQNLKPRQSLHYSYGAHDSHQFYQDRGTPGERILRCPDDTYELFSFCDEARCYALGAQAGVGGIFDPGAEVLLDPSFDFGPTHRGHSAQFRSTYMKRNPFWKKLTTLLQVAPQ